MNWRVKYPSTRTHIRSALVLLLACFGTGFSLANTAPQPSRWVASWSAASDSVGPELPPQTLRQVMRVSIGGDAVRVRISNEYGSRPLHIKSANIAVHKKGASVVSQSTRTLTRNGKREFTIAVGESVLTDAADLRIDALQQLAVSIFFPEATGTSTVHTTGFQTAYTCLGEDQTQASELRVDNQDDSRYFVTDIEVRTKTKTAAIVVVGDSTSDGVGTRIDSNMRWPDQLANRLQADKSLRHIAVVNSGISGNRILNDGLDPFLGPSTLKRLDRDALFKAGVKWIVLLQGINDIVASGMFDVPRQKVNADQIIAGMRAIIERAHAKNIRVIGATILPRQGAKGARAHTPEAELMRQQVNAWIRSANGFDAVLDFDKVLRDPAQPDRQLPEYNSGDFSHPNEVGYREMAASIDLSIFGSKGSEPLTSLRSRRGQRATTHHSDL